MKPKRPSKRSLPKPLVKASLRTQEGWVEVVKKNKEAKEDAHKEKAFLVHTILEEEKMRHAPRLNVLVTGIEEGKDATPTRDGKALCITLGYKIEDPTPFTKAWQAGKDPTKRRPLILQFPSEEARTSFIRTRVILRGLIGPPIYLDDDVSRMQVEQRRACMPRYNNHANRENGLPTVMVHRWQDHSI
ncbi:hypothetical protein L7F22_062478 [Adiantum nelumboides]|nr:hypothetical protein [Adiantum nelumboides]